jgi:hypothetical protein
MVKFEMLKFLSHRNRIRAIWTRKGSLSYEQMYRNESDSFPFPFSLLFEEYEGKKASGRVSASPNPSGNNRRRARGNEQWKSSQSV